MATVHTEYGPGRIIDRETVRGRTRCKVAGDGFEVWIDQTRLGGVSGVDDFDIEGDGSEYGYGDPDYYPSGDDDPAARLRLLRREDERGLGPGMDDSDPARYSSRLAWAPLDRGNSTELPYNPDPQYDAIGTPGDDGSSTIQPIHNIDADERLAPSDSITFKDGGDEGGPGPSPDLFAREGAIQKRAIIEWLLLQEHGPKIQKALHGILGRQRGEIAYQGMLGHSTGTSAQAVDAQASQIADWASPGGMTGGYGSMIHNSALEREGVAQLLPLLLRTVGPAVAQDVMGQIGGGAGGADLGPGEGYGEMIQASTRPSGLSDRYIDLTASVDYWNDPVAQFRHDPVEYINRVGQVMDEGLNPRFAEYMDLVEADNGIRTAAWKDVRAKAMRLKREGHVTVKDIAPNRIMASVVGDHGTYDVAIFKGGSYGGLNDGNPGHAISNWHCGCEWGKWAFRRKYTYVGRLCSHAYASYLTMQSEHMKGKPRQQRGPKRKAPSRGLPVVAPGGRGRRGHLVHADALQNGPERLTPEMVVNDVDDSRMFVDVTEDERTDVGPDDVVSDRDIVHFARVMAACERDEAPYPRELVAFLDRYADCTDGGDEDESDWEAQDGSEAEPYLEKLRSLADGDQSDDFGSMADRVKAIQRTVEEAREHGADASQFVAMLRTAEDEYQVSQDGGRTIYRGPNNRGYAYENGSYTPVDFTGRGSQGPENNRYEMGQGSYNKSTENGRDLYRYDGGDGNSGFAVQDGNVRGVQYDGQGEMGTNQRFNYDGSADGELSGFQNFLRSNPAAPAAPQQPKAPESPGAKPGGPAAANPGQQAPSAGGPAAPAAGGAAPAAGGAGSYTAPGGGQTSGNVADGGRAGAENGNNSAITKDMLDAEGNYTMQAGDTLTDVAQRATGDMNKYQDIAKANSGITNVDDIAVGTKINLKDFANDVGNNGVSGDVTNPAGGGADNDIATPEVAAPQADTSAIDNAGDAPAPPTTPKPAQQPADASKQSTASRRRAQAPSSGGGQQQQSGQPSGDSPGAQPATNPATGQPSSAGGAAVNAAATEAAGPDKDADTYDPTDPNQLAQQQQGRPGQQPATMPATVGTGSGLGGNGSGMDFGNAMDMVNMGVGAGADIASGIGGALGGGGLSGLASGVGDAIQGITSIFASKQDFDDWVRYAYPKVEGEGDLEPHDHPFAGSGYPGSLEFSTSEEYADEARRGMDDVTDLDQHDVEASMDKWQKQGSYDEATDDSSDIVRAFQANLGETALGAGAGGGQGRFDDIAGAAQGFLRTAGRNYSLAEQSELIREGDKGGARNLDSLDLRGTHYEDMTTLGW